MSPGETENKSWQTTLLKPNEIAEIEQKVKFEIARSHYSMIKLGGVTNIIAGIFVIWTLYGQESLALLISWYTVLVVASILDIAWASRYASQNITPNQLTTWRNAFYYIFALLCLTWGSIGVIFISNDLHYQIYVIAFLLATLIGFSFSSITDFKIAAMSIILLLLPTITYRAYLGIENIVLYGHDPESNLGISASLFILGSFLFVVCYIGAKLVNKFFKLSFINVALSQKLENMNQSLEKRVKERTLELENSLKLVTYQASHDLLTDLPNQRLLFEYLHGLIKTSTQTNSPFAVVFFSLNEIEKVNDGLGHHIGDFVIKTIAQRFQTMFSNPSDQKDNDIRYSVALSRKDVFVILLHPILKVEDIEKNVELLFSVLEEPIYTENQVIKLTASIGISLYPLNGKNIKSLLMNADAAMLRSRQYGGNNIHLYEDEINADMSKQLALESNLHLALNNGEFILHYQPFVDLETGRICGMEALVRWIHPVLGLISPENFIPLAEENGIIIPLGEWVLRTACKQTKIWHDLGFTSLKVAVNLSAKQLQQKNIIQMIAAILKEYNVNPANIELELTESAAFQEEAIPILKQIIVMGVGLSVDDFGTGYSSLKNLKQFKISKLKIDKSFVLDVDTNSDSRSIVSNTIELAKKLKISVLAEGVETKAHLVFLKENGCNYGQGYYFSAPVSPDIFTQLLINKKGFEV